MDKKEYGVVIKTRYTEADPDVADLIYRYVEYRPYGPSTEYWHFVATMDRDTALELCDALNYLENKGWEDYQDSPQRDLNN